MTGLVSLIDDDTAVLDAVGMFLRARGHSVAAYSNAQSFLGADFAAGCIVSDVRMPGMSGLELLNALKQSHDPRPVVLLTGHGDIAMAVQAIKLGAFDFIEKPFDRQRLLDVVDNALRLSEHNHMERTELAELEQRLSSLTNREREVMDLVVQGWVNKQIGVQLGISARTVDIYRAAVMQKIGADSFADLVRMSVRLETRRNA